MLRQWIPIAAAGLACLLLSPGSRAQVNDPGSGIQYKRGQDVAPAFEGWQRNTDGTYTFWFGYLNRNFEEQVDVPVGAENRFEPGDPDRGQPTHFYPRRHFFAFKMIVPKDWPVDQKLVWTLTSHGKTTRAKGWLEPTWEVNNGVISENISSRTVDWSNEPPSITGSGPQTVALPNTLRLSASATDDGLPKPRESRRSNANSAPKDTFNPIPIDLPEGMLRGPGLGIQWILYRGPGPVVFDPPRSEKVIGKSVSTSTVVNFSVPGNYWLRAIASDGALEAFHDVHVTVNPAPSDK
jgi:hypothetical protein